MKSKLFLMGILSISLVFGMALTSCATASSIGGTADPHGLISKAKVAAVGSEIASYTIILGLLDSGYEEYFAAVKDAEASGKTVTSVRTDYLTFFTKVTAYAE